MISFHLCLNESGNDDPQARDAAPAAGVRGGSRASSRSRAPAAELHLTQPAVSMQVKLIEEHAGLPLFERLGKKIYLTEAGTELHQHSRIIAQQLRDADEALAARKGLSRGRLVITMVSTAKYFVPPLLARFLKQHPGVTVKLSANNREVVLKQLATTRWTLPSWTNAGGHGSRRRAVRAPSACRYRRARPPALTLHRDPTREGLSLNSTVAQSELLSSAAARARSTRRAHHGDDEAAARQAACAPARRLVGVAHCLRAMHAAVLVQFGPRFGQ